MVRCKRLSHSNRSPLTIICSILSMKEWVAKRHTKESFAEAFNTGVRDEEEVAREGDGKR